jgi:hypothetical protein
MLGQSIFLLYILICSVIVLLIAQILESEVRSLYYCEGCIYLTICKSDF